MPGLAPGLTTEDFGLVGKRVRKALFGTTQAVVVAFGASLLISSLASAQPLSLDGVWGNEAGCRYARTQDNSDDGLMVLSAGGVETYATACEWVQVGKAADGTQVATGLCSHEGEDYRSVETYIIEADMADSALVRIRAANGEVWGEVRKCP